MFPKGLFVSSDSPFDLSLRDALNNLPYNTANAFCERIQLFFESAYAPEGLEGFVQTVTEMRTIDYGQLLGQLSQLSANNLGTWVPALGQTSRGNQGAGRSPYYGYSGIGMW